MNTCILALAASAALATAAFAAGTIDLGPAQANYRKFADWPEEIAAGYVDHPGGRVVVEYRVSAAGDWNGRAQVTLRDGAGHVVASLRSRYLASGGTLVTESAAGDRAQRLPTNDGVCEFVLPAGRYALTGCRATCPQLPENDAVGAPVAQAINLRASIR
ncbi:MAG TPA: hypothetical protein PK322_00225 [Opitutaceae bacterium]|nr:hypothetical protein [Opitutaceae bacterium]